MMASRRVSKLAGGGRTAAQRDKEHHRSPPQDKLGYEETPFEGLFANKRAYDMDLCVLNNARARRLEHPRAAQLAKVEAMHRRKPKRQGNARQP